MPTEKNITTILLLAGLPVLIATCLFLVAAVVDFSRRRVGETHITYRPIRTRIADALLIIRLWFGKRRD